MSLTEEETRVVELLAPLRRIEAVAVPRRRREPRRRPVLVAAAVAAALVCAGVAIAAGIGAFDGIGAAQHPQSAADLIDPQTQSYLQREVPPVRFDTSRLVGELPSGRRVWVITNARDDLCVVVEQEMDSCGGGLSSTQPTTIATYDRDGAGGQPPVSLGVARDGVVAISFMAQGHEVTVPVKNNVWAYEGDSAVLHSAVVHYADGTTATLTDGVTGH